MARQVSSAVAEARPWLKSHGDQHVGPDRAAHGLVGRNLAGGMLAAHAQLHVREAAVLDHHLLGLARHVLRLGDAEPAAV